LEITTSAAYRPDIDGLRAIAVLAVVGYHFDFQPLASGFLGVDVFFVISGFVIANSLQKRNSLSIREFMIVFWTRRMKRLFPALVVVVAVGVLIAAVIASSQSARFTGVTGMSALIGMSNLYFFRNSVDYWGATTELNFLTHTWSLGVEEQFYFLLPLLFYGFGLGGREGTSLQRLAGKSLLILLVLTSLSGFLLLGVSNPEAVFYLSPFRFWQLGVGVLLCILWPTQQTRFRLSPTIAPVAMVVLLFVLTRPASEGVARASALTASLSTVTLIYFLPQSPLTFRFLATNPMLNIGRISYSLYLWHWTVLVLFRWLTQLSTADKVVALVLSLVLAQLTYRLIEEPLRSRTWKRVIGSELSTGLIVIGTTIALLATSILTAAQLKEDPWDDVYMVHADLACHDPKWTQAPITDCLFAPKNGLPNLYVLGDSHAGNLVPSLKSAFPEVNLLYLTDAKLSSAMLHDGSTTAREGRLSEILEFINLRIDKQDVVLLAFSRDSFAYQQEKGASRDIDFANGQPRVFDAQAPRNINFESALEAIARQVGRIGARLVLFDGLPKLCGHVEFDVGKTTRPGNPCTGVTSQSLSDRTGSSAMLHRVAEKFQGEVVDSHSFLCPAAECDSVIDGKLWTWDGSPHFVNINDKILATFFEKVGSNWFGHKDN